jgi:cytochrome P450
MLRTSPFDPPPEYAALRADRPVTQVTLWDGTLAWLVTGYDEVRRLLTHPGVSSMLDRPGYPELSPGGNRTNQVGESFVNMDAPRHQIHRRMLSRDFGLQKITELRPHIREIVAQLVEEMTAGVRTADLVSSLALPVPSMVICEILGVPSRDREYFHEKACATLSLSSHPEEVRRAYEEIVDYLRELVSMKRRAPADDLVSRLLTQQVEPGNLTEEELVVMVHLLLMAGHETTANMIALGILALLDQPGQYVVLRENRELLPGAVEELLRYLSIVHLSPRRVAIEDLDIAGRRIRAGEGLLLLVSAANRDPSVFPDPDLLDLLRRPRNQIAFGYGMHLCLGQHLARAELEVTFDAVLERLPNLRLDVPIDSIRFKSDMIVYGVHELPVSW